MNLPTPYEIGVRKAVEGSRDAHGNKTVTYTAPIYLSVYSVAPTTSNEPFQAGRDAVETDLTVLAPVGTKIAAADRVVYEGKEYTVEGEPADWSKGPFSWVPGISVSLKRVEG